MALVSPPLRLAACLLLLPVGLAAAHGQSPAPAGRAFLSVPPAPGSADYSVPDADSTSSSQPGVTADPAATSGFAGAAAQAEAVRSGVRPFGSFAVALKVGVQGFGFDLATPLTQKLNLRGGGSFFQLDSTTTQDGISANGTFRFRSGRATLDYFPFGNAFRISPGVVFYNDNNIAAALSVPGGQRFTLNDQTYTSDPTNPIRGTGKLTFGNKVAPSFTVGLGNMIPRKGGRRWSVPAEIGFEYIDQPTVSFNLTGGACDQQGCAPIDTDPQTQTDLRAEERLLNDSLSPLRFFPIASIGISYRFGR